MPIIFALDGETFPTARNCPPSPPPCPYVSVPACETNPPPSSSYGGGTIPRIIASVAPSLFFYIPKHRNYFIPPLLSLFLASIFQSLSGNLDCERAQFRFTTRPLLPTCYESVAFGYKRECETRFGFEFDRLDKKTETDFLDPSPSRNLLCLSIETLLLNR